MPRRPLAHLPAPELHRHRLARGDAGALDRAGARCSSRLPDDLPLRIAALVEPAAVAVHDVRRAGLAAGSTSLVVGGGPVGLLIASVARAAGARRARAASSSAVPPRARRASSGCDAFDPGADDLSAACVEDWTDGAGADVAFEVSGAAAGLDTAIDVAGRPRPRSWSSAIHPKPPRVDLYRFFWRELTLVGARVYERERLRAGGRARRERRRSRRERADHRGRAARRAWRTAFEALEAGRGDEDPRRLRRRSRNEPPAAGLFDLTGKLAVVTGCRRGIGLAMAEALAQAGADIIGVSATARAGRQRGAAPTSRLPGRTFAGLPRRPRRPRRGRRARRRDSPTADRPIDILVNNAGTIARAPAADHTDEDWDRVLEVEPHRASSC